MKEGNQKPFTLPPREFGNAMNTIFPNFDFSNWEASQEFKLWNAGRESAALEMKDRADLLAEEAGQKARKR